MATSQQTSHSNFAHRLWMLPAVISTTCCLSEIDPLTGRRLVTRVTVQGGKMAEQSLPPSAVEADDTGSEKMEEVGGSAVVVGPSLPVERHTVLLQLC